MDVFLPRSDTKPPNRRIETPDPDAGQDGSDPCILSNTAAITSSGEAEIESPKASDTLPADDRGREAANPGITGTHFHEPGNTNQKSDQRTSKAAVDPLNGFDAYGAELSKGARFWKVYVDEADRYDNELVDGWSKSLDLILVFAALFSAVSTAFIIESSKQLQPDPTEVAAETLQAISQTLVAIASNAQVGTEAGLAGGNSTSTFVPSRAAVIVNTLWYLSLSVSIATSLIAMLAKDWCRSFLANRTGDLYSQSQRRQRKWAMIERWKMHELILVLPSLIHLSLLLFAVGLCISVWELNRTVAIPVICVTGVVALFYAWSSVAASILESFPYTTIVSTILRSKVMLKLYKTMAPPFTVWLFPIGFGVFLVFVPFIGLTGVMMFCLWRLVAFITGQFFKLSTMLQSVTHWYRMRLIDVAEILTVRCYVAGHIDGRKYFRADQWLEAKRQNPNDRANNVGDNANTSEALKWLIENCENPGSTCIGLQAISGATYQLPPEPLQECDAAQKILRILTSSTSKTESVQAIGKYSRALKFLGRSNQDTEQSDTREVLRVWIGDWQVKNEKYILGLVTDPKNPLEPNEPNLTALRAGSIAPSYVLQLLYDDPGADTVFPDHVNRLLAGSLSLHPAAQASLLRGAALISAVLPRASSSSRMYAKSCMAVISDLDLPTDKDSFRNALNDSPQLVTYVQCILALGRLPTGSPLSQGITPTTPDPSLPYARLKGVLDILLCQPEDQRDILPKLSVGIEEILSKPQHYSLDQSDAIQSPCEVLKRLRTYFQENIEQMDADLARRIADATFYTYDIAQTSTPPLSIYIFMLAIFCRQLDGFDIDYLGLALSLFSFPQISEEWMNLLHERNIIPRLVDIANASGYHGHFAATQLWLLYALLGNLPRSEYTALQSRLWDLLQTTTEPGTEVQEARLIRKGLAARILGDRGRGIYLLRYTYRIVDCIYEIGDYDGSEYERVRQHIPYQLKYVSETLRHVSSFTPPEIWNPPATQPPAEPPTTSTPPAPDHTSIAIEPAGQNPEPDENVSK